LRADIHTHTGIHTNPNDLRKVAYSKFNIIREGIGSDLLIWMTQ
jgi:hypothetical protein